MRAHSEKGFGLIGFVVLLPFLISILSLIAGSALLLKADARLKHECRTSILQSQRSVASKLGQLLKLNPQARALRAEKKWAETELKLAVAAANPPAIAAARAHLLSVQIRQTALMIRQQELLILAKRDSFSAPQKAKTAVLRGLATEARENRVGVPGVRSRSRFGHFDVVPEPKNDPTPDYQPSPSFTAKQTVDLNIDLDISPLLPSWLRRLLPTKGLKINTHCQGTIERQENEWIETLNAVR